MKIEINQNEYLMIRVATQAYILCLEHIVNEDNNDIESQKLLEQNQKFLKKLDKWQVKWSQ